MNLNPDSRNRIARAARAASLLLSLFLAVGSAARAQRGEIRHVRYEGSPVELKEREDLLALRLVPGLGPSETEAFRSRHDALAEAQLEEVSSSRLTLLRFPRSVPQATRAQELRRLAEDPAVEYATGVFEVFGVTMIPTEEILVRLRPGAAVTRIEELAFSTGAQVAGPIEWLTGGYLLRLPSDGGLDALGACERLAGSADVAFAEPNFVLLMQPLHSTNDDLFQDQWNLHEAGGDHDIDAPEGWEIRQGCSDVMIAILDDGCERHPDYASFLTQGRDFAPDIPDDDPTPNDWDGHGTACAGIAAAELNNGLGIAGVAGGAKILPVRIARSDYPGGPWNTTYLKIAHAVSWAYLNGADVLSNSWRIGAPSSLIREAIRLAVTEGRASKGAVVCVAAGNDTAAALAYPARFPESLSVGATEHDDSRAVFSNYGPGLDCAAPGVDICATDITGAGGYVAPGDPGSHDNGDYWKGFGGTSAACPQVAGLAALLICKYPDYKGSEIRARIQQTCDKAGGYGYDPTTGVSLELGYGRINIYRALSGKPQVALSPPAGEPSVYRDYSDAPLYPVAYHKSAAYEWLGLDYSPEAYESDPDDPDGRPNTLLLRQSDGFDDGVVFFPPYEPGRVGLMTVDISVEDPQSARYQLAPLFLNVWFDWESDDDYNNTHDWVIQNQIVDPTTWGTSQTQPIPCSFLVPDTAIQWHIQSGADERFLNVRVRLTWQVMLNDAAGMAETGEVQDLRILNFVEMFDEGPMYMSILESCPVWRWTNDTDLWTPCHPGFRPDGPPNGYMAAEIYHPGYIGDQGARLRTPRFDLREFTEAHLRFDHCGVEMMTGIVQVRATRQDGTEEVTPLRLFNDPVSRPPCASVVTESFDLTQWCGDGYRDVRVEFETLSHDLCGTPFPNYQDWKIDNVVVWGLDNVQPGDSFAIVTPLAPGVTELTWDTPGDDGFIREAELFNIRFAPEPITAANWRHSIWVQPDMTPMPVPGPPGNLVTAIVEKLASGMHHFCIGTQDEVTQIGICRDNGDNRPPTITSPDTLTVTEGDSVVVDVSATDPDFDRLLLTALQKPADAIFTDNGDGMGSGGWKTEVGDQGDHTFVFQARDTNGATAQHTTIVVVRPGGGPVAGACCLTDGCCKVLLPAACAAQSGQFLGVGTDCSPNPCGPARPDWVNHDVGQILLTMTDQGILGFLDATQTTGAGLHAPPSGPNHLFIGGLWVGESPAYIANRDFDADPAREWEPTTCPDGRMQVATAGPKQIIQGRYADTGGPQTRAITLLQESWAYSSPATQDDFVIVRAIVTNSGASPLTDLYAAIFVDLDMRGDGGDDTGGVDAGRKMPWITDTGGAYVGARLLDPAAGGLPASNLTLVHNPTHVYPNQYILDADKYAFLTAADPQHVLTDGSTASDYSALVAAGPFDLAPGGSQEVGFALVAGSSLTALRANSDVAQAVYQGVAADVPPVGTDLVQVLGLRSAPNPFRGSANIELALPEGGLVELTVYDVAGRRVRDLANERAARSAGRHTIVWDGRDERGQPVADGVYFLRLRSAQGHLTRSLLRLE